MKKSWLILAGGLAFLLLFGSLFTDISSAAEAANNQQISRTVRRAAPRTTSSDTVSRLIAELRRAPMTSLYYDTLPQVAQDLSNMSRNTSALLRAYKGASSNQKFRFSLLVALNHSRVIDAERDTAIAMYGRGLKDAFSWCRIESAWGIGSLGRENDLPKLVPLLDDSDNRVIDEAITAMRRLNGWSTEQISSNPVNDANRADQILDWKFWWQQNRARFEPAPPPPPSPPQYSEDNSGLSISREYTGSSVAELVIDNGFNVKQWVFLDGHLLGTVPVGSSRSFEVPFGSHRYICADSRNIRDNPVGGTEQFSQGYRLSVRIYASYR